VGGQSRLLGEAFIECSVRPGGLKDIVSTYLAFHGEGTFFHSGSFHINLEERALVKIYELIAHDSHNQPSLTR